MTVEERQKIIAKRIKQQRKKKFPELTVADFADMYGVTENTIYNWERVGKTGIIPPLDAILRLSSAEFFDCEPSYLIGDIEHETHEKTDIVKATLLTEEAIEVIQEDIRLIRINDKLTFYSRVADFINRILEYDQLYELISDTDRYLSIDDTEYIKDMGTEINKLDIALTKAQKSFFSFLDFFRPQ